MNVSRQTPRIFFVDDDEDDCFLFSNFIRQQAPCVRVDCLDRGDTLLQKLQSCEPDAYPDVIFLDLNMPVLSGYEVLDRLKAHQSWKSIPVVVLTTSSEKRDADRSYALGASLFLTKPSCIQEMERLFQQHKHVISRSV